LCSLSVFDALCVCGSEPELAASEDPN